MPQELTLTSADMSPVGSREHWAAHKYINETESFQRGILCAFATRTSDTIGPINPQTSAPPRIKRVKEFDIFQVRKNAQAFERIGVPGRIRTFDRPIKSRMLYQLSYGHRAFVHLRTARTIVLFALVSTTIFQLSKFFLNQPKSSKGIPSYPAASHTYPWRIISLHKRAASASSSKGPTTI